DRGRGHRRHAPRRRARRRLGHSGRRPAIRHARRRLQHARRLRLSAAGAARRHRHPGGRGLYVSHARACRMTLTLKVDRPKSRVLTLAGRVNIAVIVLIALYLVISVRQPIYLEPAGLMNFLRRAAPLAILASGQLFVLTSGGFDLSVGSLVTLTVNGAAMMWSGGAPRGYLPDNFRMFGRLVFHDVPIIGIFPLAIAVLAVVASLAYWALHRTVFGRWVFAIGNNPRAAELGGVRVDMVRIAVFVISALSAVTAGIMLGGFGGVSGDVGLGLELQAVAACVVGGVQLMGGRGTLIGAVAGALTLFALFTLLTLLGLPQ